MRAASLGLRNRKLLRRALVLQRHDPGHSSFTIGRLNEVVHILLVRLVDGGARSSRARLHRKALDVRSAEALLRVSASLIDGRVLIDELWPICRYTLHFAQATVKRDTRLDIGLLELAVRLIVHSLVRLKAFEPALLRTRVLDLGTLAVG